MTDESVGSDVLAKREPERSVRKRIRLVLSGLGVAIVVGGGYLVFRWRENSGHHPVYGDVGTWLTFVVAAVGIPFALYQLRLQRRQLAEQQETIKGEFERQQKRDELLDEQLNEIRERGRALERQQAEKINLFFTATAGQWKPGGLTPVEGGFHIAVVGNRSARPIRDVICYISVQADMDPMKADEIGRYVRGEVGSHHAHGSLQDIANSDRRDLMMVGEE